MIRSSACQPQADQFPALSGRHGDCRSYTTRRDTIGQLSRSLLEARLPPGFVAAQFYVLNHLIRVGDGRTPLAIARAFQVPKTSMTHSLAVLEQAGLIEIRKNPGDGRSKLVHITDAGRTFRQDAIDALAPDLKRIAAAIPPDHVARMLPDLEVLRKFLDTDRDASP